MIQTSFIGTGSHLQLKEERYLVCFFSICSTLSQPNIQYFGDGHPFYSENRGWNGDLGLGMGSGMANR